MCITPIPNYETLIVFTQYLPQTIGSPQIIVLEYQLRDLILAFMFLRLIQAISTFENYTQYSDPISLKVCYNYGFKSDSTFALKCQLATDPSGTIIRMFVITVTVLAYVLRIFEIPFYRANETLNNDMDHYFNAIWLTLITLTTVGYGDIAPKTDAGKLVMIFTAIFGAFLISMMVLAVAKIFDLNQNQHKALRHIRMSRSAAKLITSFSRYFLAKKK